MLMKKIFCIALALVMIFSLVSCTSGGEETTADTESGAKAAPVVSLVSEKTTVSPGEEITVSINIKDAPLTACFDVYVYADDYLEYVTSETVSSELILAANSEEKNGEEYFVVRGMVASTYDVIDEEICTVTYKLKEDAVAGTKINLTLQVPIYRIGLDESGNDIYSVNCELQGLVLEVQ